MECHYKQGSRIDHVGHSQKVVANLGERENVRWSASSAIFDVVSPPAGARLPRAPRLAGGRDRPARGVVGSALAASR